MRAFIGKKIPIFVISAALFCASASSGLLRADDEKDKNTPPSKATTAKPDAPAPGLTERERMLLDRVEQLERRVAELETKGTPTANPAESLTGASTAEVAVAQPKVPGAVDAPAATVTAAETAAVTAPGPSINVIPADKAIPSLSA